MKTILMTVLLVFIGFAGYRIGGSLSSDAVGMGVGMLFGIMAGIPTALLVLATSRGERGSDRHRHCDCPTCRHAYQQQIEQQQPPVIVVTTSDGRRIDQQRHQISGGEW